MKWFVVAVSAILLFLAVSPFIPSALSAQGSPPFYWQFINVDIDVQENGDMLITETQKYVFTASHINERYRYIPLDRVDRIDSVQVSEGGIILPATTGIKNNQLWIKWRHQLNPPESHTFVLKYRIVGGLHVKEDGDQVYWKAIFKDRDAPIKSGKVTVHLPASLSGEIISMKSFGVPADTRQVDTQTVEFISRSPLPPGHELEVQVTFTHGILNIPVPAWQRGPIVWRWINVGLIGISFVILFGGERWLGNIRRRRKKEPIVVSPSNVTEPPDDLPPAVVGRLIHGESGLGHILSDIFYLGEHGSLTITEEQDKHWHGTKRIFRLERGKREPQYEYQKQLMQDIFMDDTEVYLSQEGRLGEAAKRAKEGLEPEVIGMGLLEEVSEESIRAMGWGAGSLGTIGKVCFWIGLIGFFGSLFAGQWGALFLFIVVAVFGIRAGRLKQPRVILTEKGATEKAQWEAFRDYTKNIMQDEEALVKNIGRFDKYLPYTICFGVGPEWVKSFVKLDQPTPVPFWYHIYMMRAGSRALLDLRLPRWQT